MFSAKKTISTAALALLMGAGTLVVASAPASARVVCNRDGDCWHTEKAPRVPGIRFESHPDDWYFHQHWDNDHRDGDRHYRDYHEGRGYYRSGVWITL
jgi:hypothetical protein